MYVLEKLYHQCIEIKLYILFKNINCLKYIFFGFNGGFKAQKGKITNSKVSLFKKN